MKVINKVLIIAGFLLTVLFLSTSTTWATYITLSGSNNYAAQNNNLSTSEPNTSSSNLLKSDGADGKTVFKWYRYVYSTGDYIYESFYEDITKTVYMFSCDQYWIQQDEKELYCYNNGGFLICPYSKECVIFRDTEGSTFSSLDNGYYDVTITKCEANNDNWTISILKTVRQIDAVPDLTYTGSPITPEPLVLAGSLSLTKGTDYVYSYENNTNCGTAIVRATFQGDYASLGYVERTFTIVKATPTVSAPTPINTLIYTGEAQSLVTEGSTNFGTLLYSLDGENYSADIPTATNVGDYTVYYKVNESDNWNAVDAQTVTVAIAAKVTTLGALTLAQDQNGYTATIQGDFSSNESGFLRINSAINVNQVTFNRSFTKGVPATVMFPFSFDASKVNGKFYTLASVAPVNGVWTATMSDPIKGTIEANTPYIFKANSNLQKITFENGTDGFTLQSTDDIKDNGSGDWTLHGVYTKTPLDAAGAINYGFAGQAKDGISVGQFIRAGEGTWADPMRCYLTYDKNNGVLSKSALDLPDYIRVVFPDEVEQPDNGEIITPVSAISETSGAKVWSYNGTIYIEAQPDMDYTIVDLSGRVIKTGVTHTTREEVTLGKSTGIVIVKFAGKIYKLSL